MTVRERPVAMLVVVLLGRGGTRKLAHLICVTLIAPLSTRSPRDKRRNGEERGGGQALGCVMPPEFDRRVGEGDTQCSASMTSAAPEDKKCAKFTIRVHDACEYG